MSTLSSALTKIICLVLLSVSLPALAQQKATATYFAVENYYKAKWGYAEEFIQLWKTNHYPLLKKAQEKGDIISITASKPRLHGGEDIRWDYRVTIVFRNAALAFDPDLTSAYKKQLYPDQENYRKAEQHRFEILQSHWDIETVTDNLD
ncbi:hypothetical protein [Chitinophaga nivalis]|uniref:EthD domain-containing protein n=1 Tax=Chitinophaga nivalis TaxID=2991709 RepID=A0ABT3IMP5_9BACT|nr:hypothetical protein [Chitinophaga nivalis]MCW3465068.1 hypothetical protein [Chitinophaga nivalis]MCW3485240.1 hypothetical protein [Chitinophaga nivalis]